MTLVKIIAEAGVNHNGSLELALELVDEAANAGADYVKFQTFKAENLASKNARKAKYQTLTTDRDENQFDMLKRLELSVNEHEKILKRCGERGISFLSTPFDIGSLKILTEHFALDEIKLGSGELTNAPLLLAAGRSGAKIILSTGMGSLAEVEEALGVLAFAMCRKGQPNSRVDFANVLQEQDTWQILAQRVTLLHCTTDYPAAVKDTNLRAMNTMQSAFGVNVGYSDHTEGDAISLAAVALGASVIEKHFTLDRRMPGPDHAASLEPKELWALVERIRSVELALGTGIKQPSKAEVQNRPAVRKSLIAREAIDKGQTFIHDSIEIMRPGDGISPMMLWDIVGTQATIDVGDGEVIRV